MLIGARCWLVAALITGPGKVTLLSIWQVGMPILATWISGLVYSLSAYVKIAKCRAFRVGRDQIWVWEIPDEIGNARILR